jgi:hypothetical protein
MLSRCSHDTYFRLGTSLSPYTREEHASVSPQDTTVRIRDCKLYERLLSASATLRRLPKCSSYQSPRPHQDHYSARFRKRSARFTATRTPEFAPDAIGFTLVGHKSAVKLTTLLLDNIAGCCFPEVELKPLSIGVNTAVARQYMRHVGIGLEGIDGASSHLTSSIRRLHVSSQRRSHITKYLHPAREGSEH